MHITAVDFIPEHFDAMVLRAADAADLAGVDRETLLEAWRGGRTVFVDGAVAFFYGARARHGTGWLWAVTSPVGEKVPLLAVRLGKNMLRALFNAGCHRVETLCHTGNARSLAWLTRSLGFTVEGLLRQCGPNRQDRYVLSVIARDRACSAPHSHNENTGRRRACRP